MKSFKEFGITTTTESYKGDKIKTDRLLNREITVWKYEIKDSTKVAGTQCLHMQISIGETYHVVFTSAKYLMKEIQLVPELPFTTTVIKENDWLKFT